jgi:hypothetical protein
VAKSHTNLCGLIHRPRMKNVGFILYIYTQLTNVGADRGLEMQDVEDHFTFV